MTLSSLQPNDLHWSQSNASLPYKLIQKVLLVDDDEDYSHQLTRFLKREGLSVQCAASGEEALRHLGREAFHLLLTDLQMPGMNGFALARHARALSPDMPIIMITGSFSPDIPGQAEAAGIRKVFPKTFDPEELLAIITGLVEAEGKSV